MTALDRLRLRRSGGVFNLSFLDVMSCGLGAVILIFLIIKHNTESGSVEGDRVLVELQTLERETLQLREEIEDVARRNAEEQRLGSELAERQQAALELLAGIDARMTAEQQRNLQLQRSIEERQKELANDILASAGAGEEEYLTGLSVGGRRIAILLDSSASMTDERLTQIFGYKVADDARKRSAPKWQRANKAALWLLARVPSSSDVTLMSFAEQTRALGPTGWFSPQDATALQSAQRDLAALAPAGATDLTSAFDALAQLQPRPTDVYLITDGLPTQSGGRKARCARGYKVSGKCRLELFSNAMKSARDKLAPFRFNVVLLPLEGDWDAGNAYWVASASTGGRLISPPASWP
jgi:hypothetical protein